MLLLLELKKRSGSLEVRRYTHKTQCLNGRRRRPFKHYVLCVQNGSNSSILYPQGSRKKVQSLFHFLGSYVPASNYGTYGTAAVLKIEIGHLLTFGGDFLEGKKYRFFSISSSDFLMVFKDFEMLQKRYFLPSGKIPPRSSKCPRLKFILLQKPQKFQGLRNLIKSALF